MLNLTEKLRQYLRHALGIMVAFRPWPEQSRLPLFLRDRYSFFHARILTQQCLFMADQHEQEESPATVRKHIEMLHGKWGHAVVYLRERITAYKRKRLIEQQVPFVVPGTQMYLPMLGIDLREHFKRPREEMKGGLGPSAQAVLIHALLCGTEDLNPTAMAQTLGYSVMTMSRALDDLETAGLGQSAAFGRARRLRLAGTKRDVWEKAQPLLRSPVVSRHAILGERKAHEPVGLRSGLTALAEYSMLAEPRDLTFAVNHREWKAFLKKARVRPVLQDEQDGTVLEVWAYAPTLFACEGRVDRLSLYLSLRTAEDERVQAALNRMVEEIAW